MLGKLKYLGFRLSLLKLTFCIDLFTQTKQLTSSPNFASNIKGIQANYLDFIATEITRKLKVIEVNQFDSICLLLEVKFGDNL